MKLTVYLDATVPAKGVTKAFATFVSLLFFEEKALLFN